MKSLIKLQEEIRRRQYEELKTAIEKPPVPGEVLANLVWMPTADFKRVMRNHPAHSIEQRYLSLLSVLSTFRTALSDLYTSLDRFDTLSQDPWAFRRVRREQEQQAELSVRKEIYAVSSAALAIVDHCRKFVESRSLRGIIDITKVNNRRKVEFDLEEHKFIQSLRNNLHHVNFAEATLNIKLVWGPSIVQSTHFEFSVEELLASEGEYTVEAKAYMERCGTTVNVHSLFVSYSQCVEAFYSWLFDVYEKNLSPAAQDYRRCLRERHIVGKRHTWRILLGQVAGSGTTDPYTYLPQFLTPSEMDEVHTLPHRSKEQVDRIIALVDDDRACNDELRGLVYRLFKIVEM